MVLIPTISNVQAHKFRGRSPVSNLTRLVSGLGRGNWHSLCASHCQMSNVLKEDWSSFYSSSLNLQLESLPPSSCILSFNASSPATSLISLISHLSIHYQVIFYYLLSYIQRMSLKVSWVKQNENFAHSTYSSEKTKAQNEKVVMANQTNVPAPNSLPFPTAPQVCPQPSLPTHL